MKNISEFAEELILDLKASSPALSRADIRIRTKALPNNVTQTGICVLREHADAAPFIGIDGAYESYRNGMPAASLAGELAGSLVRYAVPDIRPDWLAEFRNVRDRIVCRLVPESSKDFLADRPSLPLGGTDIRIVWDILLPDNTIRGETCTTPVTDRLMGAWDTVSPGMLYRLSLDNTPRLRPASFLPMADVLAHLAGEGPGAGDLSSPGMYILTNADSCDGAAAILYPETRELLTESFPEGCCLIPSSRHEWIVVDGRYAMSPESMRSMVREVNDSDAVEPQDILSYDVFAFRGGLLSRME